MPLVRDCSCRGDSAGFAHLSCLTKYAEQKSKQAGDAAIKAFTEPWEICNNCKQNFQGQLSIDMASAFFSFAEATYGHEGNGKWDKMKVIDSLHRKILMLAVHGNEADRTEKTLLINQLLDRIAQMKKELNMSRWIHKPHDSEEYKYYIMLCGTYEAFAHSELGRIVWLDVSEEGFTGENEKIMLQHIKKARAIYNLVGMNDNAQRMDTIISVCTVNKQAANDEDASSSTERNSVLQIIKSTYERYLNTQGMNSAVTIESGLYYAKSLRDANNFVEAERLVTQLATISRRVHGPDHRITIEAAELLQLCKERYVVVPPDGQQFQALRYKNEGEICIVTGPVTEPRNTADERSYHIANSQVIPKKGCTVICNGLVSASHLNGELGEVRDFKPDGAGIRLAVHFEKKSLKSAFIKPENLRIAFELPSEKLPIESGN
jgi:hypothetical protein